MSTCLKLTFLDPLLTEPSCLLPSTFSQYRLQSTHLYKPLELSDMVHVTSDMSHIMWGDMNFRRKVLKEQEFCLICLFCSDINFMLFYSTALSEAHARLAMRHEVKYEDVSAVLYLYETAMVTLFGSCYVTPPPQPKLLDVNSLPLQVNSDICKKTHKMQFQS
jgi:hypothetical protein